MERRERTRRLIELGGLVQKSGLMDALEDDRATLYGALLELAGMVADPVASARLQELWRRRGRRAFEAEGASSDRIPQRRAQP